MANAYVGEIRIFAGNFAPQDWLLCDGRLVPIAENDALYTLIGTTYGGDGVTTFALPDLRGRLPLHQGSTFILGQMGGAETVQLISNQIPAHTHALRTTSLPGDSSVPGSGVILANHGPGDEAAAPIYAPANAAQQQLATTSITSVGGGQPHDNMQPYLCLNFIIAMYGLYPSQT